MMGVLNLKNIRLNKSVKYQFFIFIFFLISALIYSIFFPIPAQKGTFIGLGSSLLNIGDRYFYMNNGYGEAKGSFLYPLVLKIITKFLFSFEIDETSKIWNLITISISSIFGVLSLLLIDRIAYRVFGYRVAVISNWLFIICPYSLFYSINGSITLYIFFGLSLVTYVISSSAIFTKRYKEDISPFNTFLCLSLTLVFLSSLRPTGAIFSIVILLLLLFDIFFVRRESIILEKDSQKLITILMVFFVLIYSFLQIYFTYNYLLFSITNFSNEQGQFFGVERNLIRERLKFENGNLLIYIRKSLYFIIWKITEFVSGISDIRDSHSGINNIALLPFFARAFTGIFIIFPINLFAFLGLFINFKRIFNSGLFYIFLSILISVSPSLIGVAFTRYIYMFYPPIIIVSASCIEKLISFDSKK